MHNELQKQKHEFHLNAVDLYEGIEETVKDPPSRSREDELIEKSGMVRSQAEQPAPILMQPVPVAKQHNGLRCKKCFELLVRDDEFLWVVIEVPDVYSYAGGKLFVNPQILEDRHWTALHHRSGIVSPICAC